MDAGATRIEDRPLFGGRQAIGISPRIRVPSAKQEDSDSKKQPATRICGDSCAARVSEFGTSRDLRLLIRTATRAMRGTYAAFARETFSLSPAA